MLRNPHHPDNVTIPREQYHSLKRSRAMLSALEAGGVDNWDWYGEAYQDYMKAIKGKPWDNGESDD